MDIHSALERIAQLEVANQVLGDLVREADRQTSDARQQRAALWSMLKELTRRTQSDLPDCGALGCGNLTPCPEHVLIR